MKAMIGTLNFLEATAASEWGPSVPLAVPRTAVEMRKRGHDETLIQKVILENPQQFLSQCDRFQI